MTITISKAKEVQLLGFFAQVAQLRHDLSQAARITADLMAHHSAEQAVAVVDEFLTLNVLATYLEDFVFLTAHILDIFRVNVRQPVRWQFPFSITYNSVFMAGVNGYRLDPFILPLIHTSTGTTMVNAGSISSYGPSAYRYTAGFLDQDEAMRCDSMILDITGNLDSAL